MEGADRAPRLQNRCNVLQQPLRFFYRHFGPVQYGEYPNMSADIATFYNQTRAARKIIVVDLGFLGDTVHLLPSLFELRRNYPEAQLHVMATPVGCEVIAMAPWVNRGWPVERSKQRRTLHQQLQVIRAVRRERFDVAFNFSAADRTLFMTALTGARWRVAYDGGRPHFWKRGLIAHWMMPLTTGDPNYERRRQMLASCGLSLAEARFGLDPGKPATEWAGVNVPEKAIHFSICASTHLKEWPLDRWVSLAKALWRDRPGTRVIATASGKERELARLKAFAAALPGGPLQTFDQLPIPQLTALLQRCSLHVGGDSGVLHIAFACGIPTVSFFRDYPGVKGWLPRGKQHVSLMVKCPCAEQRPASCLQRETARCLAELATETVLQAVLDRMEYKG